MLMLSPMLPLRRVCVRAGAVYFQTGTQSSQGPVRLVLQGDLNVVIYDAGNHVVWSSNTSQALQVSTQLAALQPCDQILRCYCSLQCPPPPGNWR
jgi:hypothetical protein